MSRVAAGSFWKTTLTFAVVGPPVGGVFLLAWWASVAFVKTGSIEGQVWWLLAAGVFYGYVFGLLPAFFTGLLGSLVSPTLHSTGAWVASSAGIGWVVTVLVLGANGFLTDDAAGQFWNGLIGAIPAVVCAGVTRRLRPRGSRAPS